MKAGGSPSTREKWRINQTNDQIKVTIETEYTAKLVFGRRSLTDRWYRLA